jgi:hypothetical protein
MWDNGGWQMSEYGTMLEKADRYRVWLDCRSVGHIRITRRVSTSVIISLVKFAYLAMRRQGIHKPSLVVHISRSLSSETSKSMDTFLEFCRDCLELDIKVIILE